MFISLIVAIGLFLGTGFLYPVWKNRSLNVGKSLGKKVEQFQQVKQARIAVFPLTYKDSTETEIASFPTAAQLHQTIFDEQSEVAKWLHAQSFGNFSLTGEVFEPTRLKQNYILPNGSPRWVEGFNSVQLTKPVDVSDFDVLIFVPMHAKGLSTAVAWDLKRDSFSVNDDTVSKETSIMWTPLVVGENPDGSPNDSFTEHQRLWAKADADAMVEGTWNSPLTRFQHTFLHELIHAIGFQAHCNSRTGDAVPYWQADVDSKHYSYEYGNHFELMGDGSWAAGLSSFAKHRLGWDSDRIISVEKGQQKSVTLFPNDSKVGIIAVQIFNDNEYTTWDRPMDSDFTETGYWIEVLPSKKTYSSNLDFVVENSAGLIVHVTDGQNLFLLDTSPSPLRTYEWGSTADTSDVVLRDGQSFDDGRIHISHVKLHESGTVSFDIAKNR